MTAQRENEIAAIAEQILMRYGNHTFPIDPIPIAEKIGLSVWQATLPRDVSGQILYKEKKIFIEKSDHIYRQIFSIAHELGHFLLHNDGTSHISKRDLTTKQGTDSKEIEANHFAACLLMPKDEVQRMVNLGFALDSMANYFGISAIAMNVRLSNLGIRTYV